MAKRAFDFIASFTGLIILAPVFLAVALAIKLDSRGPVFYRGTRVGKDGKPFRIFKFRTMFADAGRNSALARGAELTHRADPRITRLGRFLRRTKLDELPQLINVLLGEMSLVGPRPEDPRYVEFYSPQQRQLLTLRPGMTSLASIRYRNEEEHLPPEAWEKVYVETILPAKLDLELNYLATRSLSQDLVILFATLLALVKDHIHFGRISRAINHFEEFLGRYLTWVGADAILILVAYIAALLVRSINARLDFPLAIVQAAGGVMIYILVNHYFDIYRRFWRYASAQEAVILFISVATATLIITVIEFFLPERVLPLGAVWLGGFFTFCLLAVARYRRGLVSGLRQMFQTASLTSGQGARVLIVGAEEDGQLLVWQLQNSFHGQPYQVVGLVDTDIRKHGKRIHNVPVFGDWHRIPELATKLHPDLIIISSPPGDPKAARELLTLCRATAAKIKILPGLVNWLGRDGGLSDLHDLVDEDLLQRAAYHIDEEVCHRLLSGRVVMVTGASGSIGSELCRQIAAFAPRQLVLVDTNESGLHDLKTELQIKASHIPTSAALTDITNVSRLRAIFEKTRPEIVFHAAAYKHVPVLEEYPQEAIRVNVLGTQVVYSLAENFGAEKFVFISSDKAVNPSNVLGMTKWLGELIVTATRREGKMLSTAVRFGNVLGSRGSVIPTFQKQIELGGPITITHPDMTRYFLSTSEAVSLVIQAAGMTRGDDVYMLNMGVPISIVELAHRLIRMHGLRPEKDIAIRMTGPRPGEKMSEELVSEDEERLATEHPFIFRIERKQPLELEGLDRRLDELIAFSADGATPSAAYAALKQLVAELRPQLATS